MDIVKMKRNCLGDTRTATHMPTKEEFRDANWSHKDDVVDLPDLTIHLLEYLCEKIPEQVTERFHFADNHLKVVELLDAVCSGRGWLLKGAQYDYDRCCSVVMDEFRAGKLGRITLEDPPKNTDGEMDDD